jgi:ATP/maltotriose-dependent transcriptional regulator MalT
VNRLPGDASCGYRTTDHSVEIAETLSNANRIGADPLDALCSRLAAELLQSHDETGLSLDDWPTARRFVEHFTGVPVLPNLV